MSYAKPGLIICAISLPVFLLNEYYATIALLFGVYTIIQAEAMNGRVWGDSGIDVERLLRAEEILKELGFKPELLDSDYIIPEEFKNRLKPSDDI